MHNFITPRVGLGLKPSALVRVDALNARLAALGAPAFCFAPTVPSSIPAWKLPAGEIYGADGLPELWPDGLELLAPPETAPVVSTGTPASLALVERVAREWDCFQKIRKMRGDFWAAFESDI